MENDLKLDLKPHCRLSIKYIDCSFYTQYIYIKSSSCKKLRSSLLVAFYAL